MIFVIVGLKDLAKPSPFHIRPKAHSEEEEMPEDEQSESRLNEGMEGAWQARGVGDSHPRTGSPFPLGRRAV